MPDEAGVEMLVSEPAWTCGRSENLMLLVWRGPTTIQHARRVARVAAEMASTHKAKGFACLAVVEPKAPPPDADARPVFAKAMRDCGSAMRAGAYVVPGGGFGGAAMRAVIAGLSLLAREPYPTEVFATPEPAAAWIVKYLGDGWTSARALAAISRMRQG